MAITILLQNHFERENKIKDTLNYTNILLMLDNLKLTKIILGRFSHQSLPFFRHTRSYQSTYLFLQRMRLSLTLPVLEYFGSVVCAIFENFKAKLTLNVLCAFR